jgi:hypothetical protein
MYSKGHFHTKITVTGKCILGLVWLVFGVLCHFQQYFSYIVAVSFIGGESVVLGENHQPALKSLTYLIT